VRVAPAPLSFVDASAAVLSASCVFVHGSRDVERLLLARSIRYSLRAEEGARARQRWATPSRLRHVAGRSRREASRLQSQRRHERDDDEVHRHDQARRCARRPGFGRLCRKQADPGADRASLFLLFRMRCIRKCSLFWCMQTSGMVTEPKLPGSGTYLADSFGSITLKKADLNERQKRKTERSGQGLG